MTRLLLSLLLLPGLAAATPPVLLEQDRGVFTQANAWEAAASDEQIDPDESSDFTPFSAAVLSSASTTDATADADASIDSNVDGSIWTATGDAGSDASSLDPDALGEAPADSFFELRFEATADELFVLEGTIDASSGSGESYASVELVDEDLGISLCSHEVSPGQAESFSDQGMLENGKRYRLTAFALSHAAADTTPASSTGDAGYDLRFHLPEPSGQLGLAVGLAALALLRRLRGPR